MSYGIHVVRFREGCEKRPSQYGVALMGQGSGSSTFTFFEGEDALKQHLLFRHQLRPDLVGKHVEEAMHKGLTDIEKL